ncbi:MAG: thioredoxin family protein [Saprospiraceae bacterium]
MKNLWNALFTLCLMGTLFVSCGEQQVANQASTEESPAKVNESPGKKNNAEGKAVKIVKTTGYQVGDKAEDFKLKNVDGSMVSLSDMKEAKGFIVTFTCNHCPYSVLYEDRLIDLHNEFAAKGYPVIAINPNDPAAQPGDSFADMQVRAKEKEFPFAYLFDDGQKVYPKFGATRTPHVFILDKEMVVQYIGAIDDNAKDASAVEEHYVKDAIAALEAGKTPDPSFTKAIGCSIKKL